MSSERVVYVLSDSVGETAELVVKAGLSQFNGQEFKIFRVPYVEDKLTIDETLQIAKENDGLIGFTLVNPTLRNYLNEQAKKIDVEVIDIMGPMIDAMERVFNKEPRLEAGLVH